jgi:hypothetical protein
MEADSETEEYGIVANVQSDHALRTGAKVWILYCNGDAERPKVMGLSKGGRRIIKHMAYKRLTNFRAAWIPENVRKDVVWSFSKDAAQQLAERLKQRWQDVRFFHPDGTC